MDAELPFFPALILNENFQLFSKHMPRSLARSLTYYSFFSLLFSLLHVFHRLIRRVPLRSFDKPAQAYASTPELGAADPPSPCSRYAAFLLATSILLCYYLAAKVMSPSLPLPALPPLLPPCHPSLSLFSFFFSPAWPHGQQGGNGEKRKKKQANSLKYAWTKRTPFALTCIFDMLFFHALCMITSIYGYCLYCCSTCKVEVCRARTLRTRTQ